MVRFDGRARNGRIAVRWEGLDLGGNGRVGGWEVWVEVDLVDQLLRFHSSSHGYPMGSIILEGEMISMHISRS